MKVYGELELCFDGLPLSTVTDSIISTDAVSWYRNTELEDRVNRFGGSQQLCFTVRGSGDSSSVPEANLWLAPSGNKLYVSNIVPAKKSRLSTDEYNAILKRFNDQILGPAAAELGLVTNLLRTEEVDLEDYVSAGTAAALRGFSRSANKSTGSSHPLDKRRWNDFIISYHRKHESIPTDVLTSWLEEDGWDQDSATEMVIELEQGSELLNQYDPVSKEA